MEALNELDLSSNYFLDHSSLLSLSTLIALQYINLLGNPLACHPKHRSATAQYLHKNTASAKVIVFTCSFEFKIKKKKNAFFFFVT